MAAELEQLSQDFRRRGLFEEAKYFHREAAKLRDKAIPDFAQIDGELARVAEIRQRKEPTLPYDYTESLNYLPEEENVDLASVSAVNRLTADPDVVIVENRMSQSESEKQIHISSTIRIAPLTPIQDPGEFRVFLAGLTGSYKWDTFWNDSETGAPQAWRLPNIDYIRTGEQDGKTLWEHPHIIVYPDRALAETAKHANKKSIHDILQKDVAECLPPGTLKDLSLLTEHRHTVNETLTQRWLAGDNLIAFYFDANNHIRNRYYREPTREETPDSIGLVTFELPTQLKANIDSLLYHVNPESREFKEVVLDFITGKYAQKGYQRNPIRYTGLVANSDYFFQKREWTVEGLASRLALPFGSEARKIFTQLNACLRG